MYIKIIPKNKKDRKLAKILQKIDNRIIHNIFKGGKAKMMIEERRYTGKTFPRTKEVCKV